MAGPRRLEGQCGVGADVGQVAVIDYLAVVDHCGHHGGWLAGGTKELRTFPASDNVGVLASPPPDASV